MTNKIVQMGGLMIWLLSVVIWGGHALADMPLGLDDQNNLKIDIEIQGMNREMVVHFSPKLAKSKKPAPIIVFLHGFNATSTGTMEYTNFNHYADKEGYIVIYPQGLVHAYEWGTGTQWDAWFGSGTGENDIAFINQAIDLVIENYHADETKVFMTGYSNGASMTYRMLCESGQRLAGIATVASQMQFLANQPDCAYYGKMPLLHIQSKDDPIVPWQGYPEFTYPVEESIEAWVVRNECVGRVKVKNVKESKIDDQSSAIRTRYKRCADGNKLEFIALEGAGHAWPNAMFEVDGLSPINRDVNASKSIVKFFSKL